MKIKTLSRWAIVAALSAPLAASAQSTNTDKTNTSDKTKPTTSSDKDKTTTRTNDNNTNVGTNKPGTDKTKMAAEKLTADETKIMAHVHHVNQMEVDLGKLAQTKSTTQAVKDYGKQLVTDHQSADKDLLAFAKKQKTTIPADKPKDEAEQKEQKDSMDAVKHLRTLKGSDFDKEFLTMMVQDHEKEISKLDTNIGSIQNADLASMMRDLKPVLQKHADNARDLQKTQPQAMK